MSEPGIVVTRQEGPAGTLGRLLRERGFRVHHWPTIRIVAPEDAAPLEHALGELAAFDWVVFTSPRAVAAVLDRLGDRGGERIHLPRPAPRIAAIGGSTAAALHGAGWPLDVVPDTQTGESLVTALLDAGLDPGTRVLFPASAIARDTVPDGLGEAGAVVVRVEAYRTESAPLDRGVCGEALRAGGVSLVTFTSPSTVVNLERALGRDLFERLRSMARAVTIGPTTAEAAERAGLEVVVAEPHSLEGLAERAARLVAHDRIEEG